MGGALRAHGTSGRRGVPRRVPVLLVGVALGTAALAWSVHLLLVAGWGPLLAADDAVLNATHEVAAGSPALVVALKALSRVGVPIVYQVLTVVAAGLLLRRRRPATAVFVLVTVLVGLQLAPWLKSLVRRPRPVLQDPVATAGGYGFPSGHAVGVTVVVLALLVAAVLVLGRRVRPPVFVAGGLLVAVMCAARVVLGVHHLSDVVAGFLIGVSWCALCTALALPHLSRWDHPERAVAGL